MDVPTIIGRINVWSSAEYSGLQLVENKRDETGHYPNGPAALYAWSDGVVTWTEERSDLTARYTTALITGFTGRVVIDDIDDVAEQLGKGRPQPPVGSPGENDGWTHP